MPVLPSSRVFAQQLPCLKVPGISVNMGSVFRGAGIFRKAIIRAGCECGTGGSCQFRVETRCSQTGDGVASSEPEGIGPEKYDETSAAMIALVKYGSGMPFYRLEKLEQALGIPLSSPTQWRSWKTEAEVIPERRATN